MQTSTEKQLDQGQVLNAIDSVLVLCGSVTTTPLARRLNRSLVDLPLPNDETLAVRHKKAIRSFAESHGLNNLGIRFLHDHDGHAPNSVSASESHRCTIEQDPNPIRGVAGLLADATEQIDDDRYIVVASGALVFLEPFGSLVESMAATTSDVSFVASADGSPVGIWLIRCGVLRSINPVGYIDLKEQAIQQWRDTHRVRVVERRRSYALPTRSLPEYLNALHAVSSGRIITASVDEDPYREEWESSFSVREPGSDIAPDAVLHDSIVLNGSRVGSGAVVVRSVLCEGAVVQPGAMVADQVVTGTIRKGRNS